MRFYNDLTMRKEEFVPIEEGKVRMYCLNIGFSEEAELVETYEKLAAGGKNNIQPRPADQGITEGSLIDKFGICWILRTIQK